MTDKTNSLRNIVLVSHGGAGKTSLAETILYKSGVTNRLGKIDEGNTIMDFEPEEIKRGSSISSAFHQFKWNNNLISLIDTPGDQNFFADTKNCMQAADGVVVLIDAVDGIKVQTEQAWDFAEEFGQPCAIFINKLDRERSDFFKVFESAEQMLKPKPIKLQIPIGAEHEFKGVVDLISMKAYTYDDGKATEGDIPGDMKSIAEKERESFIENVAEADDELIERYLEGEDLSNDEINKALRAGIISRTFVSGYLRVNNKRHRN